MLKNALFIKGFLTLPINKEYSLFFKINISLKVYRNMKIGSIKITAILSGLRNCMNFYFPFAFESSEETNSLYTSNLSHNHYMSPTTTPVWFFKLILYLCYWMTTHLLPWGSFVYHRILSFIICMSIIIKFLFSTSHCLVSFQRLSPSKPWVLSNTVILYFNFDY